MERDRLRIKVYRKLSTLCATFNIFFSFKLKHLSLFTSRTMDLEFEFNIILLSRVIYEELDFTQNFA